MTDVVGGSQVDTRGPGPWADGYRFPAQADGVDAAAKDDTLFNKVRDTLGAAILAVGDNVALLPPRDMAGESSMFRKVYGWFDFGRNIANTEVMQDFVSYVDESPHLAAGIGGGMAVVGALHPNASGENLEGMVGEAYRIVHPGATAAVVVLDGINLGKATVTALSDLPPPSTPRPALPGGQYVDDVVEILDDTPPGERVPSVAEARATRSAPGGSGGPDINVQKQAGHVPGTPQYLNRIRAGKITSAFFDVADADSLTWDAWASGTVVSRPGQPAIKLLEFNRPVGIGPAGGGYQTQVRVSIDNAGTIHGTPWGPVYEGPLPRRP